MLKVFVSGADGFIGSHLTEELINRKYNVIALTHYNSFDNIGWLTDLNKIKPKNLKIVSGDIRDNNLIENYTKNVDIIFHLASLIAIPYSYISPRSYVDTNILGTLNILEAAKKNNVKKVVHTSTSEVYGSAQYAPIDEKHPNVGQSPYSASKIAADQIAFSYYSSFDLPVTILRPFNTYGPRQSVRAVIPTIISQIINNKKNIKLGNVNTSRDFNFVSDTVAAFINCINNDSVNGKIINIGSGYDVTIKQLTNIISRIMKKEINIHSDRIRFRPDKSEVVRLIASNKLAKKYLKWKPQYSGENGLEKGLKKTIKWFTNKDNLDLYNKDYSL
tara:strand:+ start:1490 stop:2485 length:996 start_codon:yes stop_codon:yes gene_type:complete